MSEALESEGGSGDIRLYVFSKGFLYGLADSGLTIFKVVKVWAGGYHNPIDFEPYKVELSYFVKSLSKYDDNVSVSYDAPPESIFDPENRFGNKRKIKPRIPMVGELFTWDFEEKEMRVDKDSLDMLGLFCDSVEVNETPDYLDVRVVHNKIPTVFHYLKEIQKFLVYDIFPYRSIIYDIDSFRVFHAFLDKDEVLSSKTPLFNRYDKVYFEFTEPFLINRQ